MFDFVEVTMAKDEETEFELVRTHPQLAFGVVRMNEDLRLGCLVPLLVRLEQ